MNTRITRSWGITKRADLDKAVREEKLFTWADTFAFESAHEGVATFCRPSDVYKIFISVRVSSFQSDMTVHDLYMLLKD